MKKRPPEGPTINRMSREKISRHLWTRFALNLTRVGTRSVTISRFPFQRRSPQESLGCTFEGRIFRRVLRHCVPIAALLLVACELIPSKPEAVFVLYRDRMKSEQLTKARDLLTDTSRNLATQLASEYKLKQLPENLAVLNVLDPVTPPVITKVEDRLALIQVRTLKGGVRLVRLVRETPSASWKIDISQELKALQKFLGARTALDTVREQAGEYAASWRAFSDQLSRMKVPENELQKSVSESVNEQASDAAEKPSVRRGTNKPTTTVRRRRTRRSKPSRHHRSPRRRRTVRNGQAR